MNREALLEIADLIEKSKPSNFHMGSWFGKMTPMEEIEDNDPELFWDLEEHFNFDDVVNIGFSYSEWGGMKNLIDPVFQEGLACNTTACIAGWTVFNDCIKNNHTNLPYSIEARAADILDLSNHEAARLFFCGESSIWNEISHQYEFDYDRDRPETWSFPPVMVASVLRRIANGDLCLDDEDYDSIS